MKFKRVCIFVGGSVLAIGAFAATVNPFADNNGQVPSPSEYSGPLFKLNHKYPSQAPVPAMPWRAAINNGVITGFIAVSFQMLLSVSAAVLS